MSTDWFLQELVDITNRTGVGVGVTLFVEGMLVTGSLVSGKAYFEGLAALPLENRNYPELAEAYKKLFASTAEGLETPDDDSRPATFVHLQDARVVTANGNLPTTSGMWWRGRISAVSGFWLGALKSD